MKVRKIATNPPLYNVNGGILHNGKVYVLTNGGTVRGLYHLNVTTGEAECLLNNFRGRHLNSPNDLVVDNEGNILFTEYVTLNPAALHANWHHRLIVIWQSCLRLGTKMAWRRRA